MYTSACRSSDLRCTLNASFRADMELSESEATAEDVSKETIEYSAVFVVNLFAARADRQMIGTSFAAHGWRILAGKMVQNFHTPTRLFPLFGGQSQTWRPAWAGLTDLSCSCTLLRFVTDSSFVFRYPTLLVGG